MTTISASTPLMRAPTGSVDAALAHAARSSRLADVHDYIVTVYRIAPTVGLDPAILVAQSSEETTDPDTGIPWASEWWVDTLNPAGIGIMGEGSLDNMVYANGEEAAKAQVAHMLGYVRGSAPQIAEPWLKFDPRWNELMQSGMAGTVTTVGDLGGGVWAEDPGYAGKIVEHYNAIFGKEETKTVKTPTTYSVPTPPIYDLAKDYARYGLSQSQANEILSHRFTNRNGGSPQFIVLHIQDGSTRGSLSYWVGVEASSTVMVQKDGSVLRIIPDQHGPWTNGDVKYPSAQATPLIALGGNANNWSVTIEAEGGPWDTMPTVQKNAIVWVCEDWFMKHPDIAERGPDSVLRHGFINTIDKINCGLYRPEIVAALSAWIDAAPAPTPEPEPEPIPEPLYPAGMTFELARELYGTVKPSWSSKEIGFDPERTECQAWLVWGKSQLEKGENYQHATWPALTKIIRRGKTKNVHAYRYSDGKVYEKVVRTDEPAKKEA